VRQQHTGPREVPPRQRRLEILAVAAAHQMGVVVLDAGEIERRLPLADDHAPVAQRPPAEALDAGDPGVRARIVIVVAGDEVDAVGRAQLGQGRDLGGEVADAAVDEVAGDGDQVRGERTASLHQMSREAAVEQRADVQVAELHDAETVEPGRQARQRDLDALQTRRGQGSAQAGAAGEERHREHRQRLHPRRRQRGR